MHKLESDQENETHKILRNFEIQTDHLILAKIQNLVINNKKEKEKKTRRIVDFAVSADHRENEIKESEKSDKYLDLARKLKKYGL